MLSARIAPVANILNNVNGLPTHALLVHFTVVTSTVGALGGLAYVLVPRFRAWLSVPLMFVGAASVVLGIVTPSSGEQLEARVGVDPLLEKHTELGDQMGTIMIAYGVLLIAAMLVARYRGSAAPRHDDHAPAPLERVGGIPGRTLDAFSLQPLLATILTVLVFVGAVVSGIWIVRTGDAGAKSVWHDTPASSAGAGDEG